MVNHLFNTFLMPLLFNKNLNKNLKLGIWFIKEDDIFILKNIFLNKNQLKIYNLIKNNYKKKIQWLSARILIKNIIKNDNIYCLFYNDNIGKPSFINNKYFISISHSKDYVIILLSDFFSVGIDIEYINYNRNIMIKNKFLNFFEKKLSYHNMSIVKMHLCWSIKESIYKCYNNRFISLKNDITIPYFELVNFDILTVKVLDFFFIKVYYIINYNYVITWCINYEKRL